jgi:hypothetical protein
MNGPVETLSELVEGVCEAELRRVELARGAARLEARQEWALDGSLSMKSWLVYRCRMLRRDAESLLVLGRFLEKFEAVAVAASEPGESRLSLGQVELLRRMVSPKTEGLFAEHQAGVVEAVRLLDVRATSLVCGEWQKRAQALVDDDEPAVPPERSLRWGVGEDGTMVGSFVLDPVVREHLEKAIETAIRFDGGDDARPVERRRADALFDVLAFFNANHDREGTPRNRPHVELTVESDVTVDDAPFDHEVVDEESEPDTVVPVVTPSLRWDLRSLPGFEAPGRWYAATARGPLDQATADAFSCDCVVHRVIRAGSSVLDYGRGTRTAPLPLFRVLVVRDGGCRHPGCDRPVAWCEAHHIVHWEHGGPTDVSNMVLFCARHHHLIHTKGWKVTLLSDATVKLVTPDGRTLTSRPRARPSPRRQPALVT